MLFPPLMLRAQGPGSQVGETCLRLYRAGGRTYEIFNEFPQFRIQLANSKSIRSIFLNLSFPEKVEIVEPKTSGQPQNETKTKNQIKECEKEKGTKEPENKKEREEIGESNVFGFLTEHFNLTEEVEMDDLTPDAEPNQAEEEDSDPEIRELEGKNKCQHQMPLRMQ